MKCLTQKINDMKKIMLSLLLLTGIKGVSQTALDSVMVTLNVQARDLIYISRSISKDETVENLYDSIKIKFRVPVHPQGTTVVSVTGYVKDWIDVAKRLQNDVMAYKFNHADRYRTLLQNSGNAYMVTLLNALIDNDVLDHDATMLLGEHIVTRKPYWMLLND